MIAFGMYTPVDIVDVGYQFVDFNWLDEKRICAARQALDTAAHIWPAGQHDDPEFPLPFK